MNKSQPLRVLFVSLFLLMTLASCGGGGESSPTGNETRNSESDTIDKESNLDTDDEAEDKKHKRRHPNNLKYIKSASIEVKEIWIRDENDVETQLLTTNKIFKLVPFDNDFADMHIELSELPPGIYDRVRLILNSGEVLLTNNVYVAQHKNIRGNFKHKWEDKFSHSHRSAKRQPTNPYLYTTQLRNLKFPSGFHHGIKVNIEPPIKIVSTLETRLLVLSFDLTKSFVFNGSATHKPGVKKVLFKPVIKVSNQSTHGIVALKGLSGSDATGVKCTSTPSILTDASVTAIETSEQNPTVYTKTDENGDAELILLPGNYNIEISKEGYETIVENKDIYVANKTPDIEEITLRKARAIATPEFDKDIGILLSEMSDHAYTKHNRDDELEIDWNPSLEDENMKVKETCWTVSHQIAVDNGTQLFIALNKETGDIIVSFAGTEAAKLETNERVEAFKDLIVDAGIIKSKMTVTHKGKTVSYPGSVHSGFAISYASIRSELVDYLKQALKELKEGGANPANSRIYFTGHSLGGSLAAIAALDMANYLKEVGYNENNIIMYSFGSSRTLTHNKNGNSLRTKYTEVVPNHFAVIARDDIGPHLLGLYDGSNSYYHLENLTVLNTNIKPEDYSHGIAPHTKIGNTRIVYSKGERYQGCFDSGSIAGHDLLTYSKRMDKIAEGNGIPVVDLDAYYDTFGIDEWKLQLRWGAGVQGPCDWVALYSTDRGAAAPTDANAYLKIPADNWQWVVKGQYYGTNATSWHDTNKNPTVANPLSDKLEDKDFWIGYVDGFGRIIKTKKWDRILDK